MSTNPNYYAIIPAEIRYDSQLSANEKLMYGEITALANNTGECWASNAYFANLYNKDIRTITRWISHLIKLGFIDCKLQYKNCLLYTSPSPRDRTRSRMPSSA